MRSIPWQWFSVLLLMFHWRDLSRDSDFLYCFLCFTDVVYPRIVIFCTVPSVLLTWSIPWQWFSVLFLKLCFTDVVYPLTDFLFCSLSYASLTWSIPWQWCSVLFLMLHWRGLSHDTDFLYCSLCFTDVIYPVILIFCTVPSVSLTWSIPR